MRPTTFIADGSTMAISFAPLFSTSSAGDGVCARAGTACRTMNTTTNRAVHIRNVSLITMSKVSATASGHKGNKTSAAEALFSSRLVGTTRALSVSQTAVVVQVESENSEWLVPTKRLEFTAIGWSNISFHR